jgi:probable rRNA maturation factor
MLKLNLTGEAPAVLKLVDLLNQKRPDWLKDGQINLKLVDDASIRALNKEYAQLDESTDVLAFPYDEEGELGDIAISLDTAKRQAGSAGISLDEELATLTLHGILHIHGFDHAEPQEREEMDRLQSELLTEAGITYRDFNWKS